jgi:type IV pilus assembly protein PilE
MTSKTINAAKNGRISFPRSRAIHGSRRRCQGFKLFEFMIVIAIACTVGITAVSASSGSSKANGQGKRANAQVALAEIALQEEQYFLNNKRYTDHLGSNGLGIETTTTPGSHYVLEVELPADACPVGFCYIVSAIPQGAQEDDECGTLSLTSDGTKLPAGCW